MGNQAENLRFLVQQMKKDFQRNIKSVPNGTRVIAVTSGKGGVGKSSFAVNCALALSKYKQRVIILDADLGLANVDIILGINPQYNLSHVIAGEMPLSEIIFNGPRGIKIIPGGSGMYHLANLKDWQLESFLAKLSHLDGMADYLIVDTGAGLSKTVLSFVLSSDEVFLLTTTEPTAMTDAYGLVKTIHAEKYQGRIKLIVNRVPSEVEAKIAYSKLNIALERFLHYSIDYLGHLQEDPRVAQSVKEQQPYVLSYPHTVAANDINTIAERIIKRDDTDYSGHTVKDFFGRVTEYFR